MPSVPYQGGYGMLSGAGCTCIPGPDVAALPINCNLTIHQELELQCVAIRIICLSRPGYGGSHVLRAGRGGRQAGHGGGLIGRLGHLLLLLLDRRLAGEADWRYRGHRLLCCLGLALHRRLGLRPRLGGIDAEVGDLLAVGRLGADLVIIADPDAHLVVSGIC